MRGPAESGVESPVLHISSFEHPRDDTNEAFIVDSLAQQIDQDAVIDVVEEPDHIDVHQPLDAVPGVLDRG